MLHALPFQCSISGVLAFDPTAQASAADTTVTEARPARDGSPAGAGTGVQEVPSKCSIKLPNVPAAKLESLPTAHPSEAPEKATAWSRASSPAGTGAVATIDHRVPSKCSATGPPTNGVVPVGVNPTSQASVGRAAATPPKSAPPAPGGLGAGTNFSAVPAAAAGPAASRIEDSRPAAMGTSLRSVPISPRECAISTPQAREGTPMSAERLHINTDQDRRRFRPAVRAQLHGGYAVAVGDHERAWHGPRRLYQPILYPVLDLPCGYARGRAAVGRRVGARLA